MFFDLPEPDLLVRGPDPAPDTSIIKKNSKKNFDSYFCLFYDILYLKNDVLVNVAVKILM